MRKPVVLFSVIIALVVFLSLARRLAQPVITSAGADPIAQADYEASSNSAEQPSADEQTRMPAPPVFPQVRPNVTTSNRTAIADVTARHKQIRKSRKIIANQNRLAAGGGSVRVSPQSEQETKQSNPYSALLGDVKKSLRNVRDYGARGIGTPQWIESLSGRKTLVPVRDFSASQEKKQVDESSGIIVPVASDTSFAH